MNENKINQYRKFVSIASQSAKIYSDMGGDGCGIQVLSALFKWPDVIYDLLNIIDGREDAEDAFVSDIGQIMLNPIIALTSAYLARADLPQNEKEAYQTILNRRPTNTVEEIAGHRDLIVNILV